MTPSTRHRPRCWRLLLRATLAAAAAACAPQAGAQATPYVGQVVCGAFSFAPRGFAKADGQLLPIASNTALFSLLGTTYGGNGTTNFALPDMRGRSVLGDGQGPGLTPRSLGEVGGAESVLLGLMQMPAHQHAVTQLGSSADATLVSAQGAVPATKGRALPLYAPAANPPVAGMAPISTSVAGGGQPVPTLPPYLTVNCFIALQGIFPPRQ